MLRVFWNFGMDLFTPEQDKYFAALGKFIAFWATAELMLDLMLQHMIRLWRGECPYKGIPKGFRRKVELFRRYIKECMGDPSDPDGAEKLSMVLNHVVDQIANVAEARHWAAHGSAVSSITLRPEAGKALFRRSVHDRPGQIEQRTYSIPQLNALTTDSFNIAMWLFAFGWIELGVVSEDQFYEAYPKLRGELAIIFPSFTLASDTGP